MEERPSLPRQMLGLRMRTCTRMRATARPGGQAEVGNIAMMNALRSTLPAGACCRRMVRYGWQMDVGLCCLSFLCCLTLSVTIICRDPFFCLS